MFPLAQLEMRTRKPAYHPADGDAKASAKAASLARGPARRFRAACSIRIGGGRPARYDWTLGACGARRRSVCTRLRCWMRRHVADGGADGDGASLPDARTIPGPKGALGEAAVGCSPLVHGYRPGPAIGRRSRTSRAGWPHGADGGRARARRIRVIPDQMRLRGPRRPRAARTRSNLNATGTAAAAASRSTPMA